MGKKNPVEFRFDFLEFWDKFFFWDQRAPSIGEPLLRKGHLVQVRGTKFVCFADLTCPFNCQKTPDATFELTEETAR